MRPFILVAFLLHLFVLTHGQNVDSIARSLDSSNKMLEEHSKKFQQLEDSLYRQAMQRTMEQKGQTLDNFLADMKKREQEEQRQFYIRIGLGVAFVLGLVIVFLRKRRRENNPS